MMAKAVKRRSKAIKEAVIEKKDQRWHCRNRVTLVFGSNDPEELDTYLYTDDSIEFKTINFHQAKSKAIEEILDNSIDEFYRGYVTEIRTELSEDGKTVTINDNGIGFPVNKAKMVYSEFRTGSKFKDEEVDKNGFLHRTLGQNGLGASATCLTSDIFKATVRHYNSKKSQTFTFVDGALKIRKGPVKSFKGASGVKVELTLSEEVYKDNTIDKELLRKRIIDLAYNNPGLIFYFNGIKYLYKKGLYELAQRIDPENANLLGDESFIIDGINNKGKKYKARYDIVVATTIDKKSDERERFISFVNSTPTYDGGYHHDRVRRLFINSIKEKLERTARKQKITLSDNDILTGLTFVIGITMPNPRFESQTKRKLVRDQKLEKNLELFMAKQMDRFIRRNRDLMDTILERASARHRFQELKDATKKGKKQRKQRVEKLLDANERKDRSNCTLFICEGDSAIGGLRSARNRQYQGGIAIKGKSMNVSQASINDVLENKEFSDIMASIGLTIGQPANLLDMRFSRIVFLADSDVDGGHINTLLTNFFFQYWPELFEQNAIEIAKAPLFEVISDKGTLYVESEGELEALKESTVKIKEIQRNKGLGEMSPEAWKYVMSKEGYTTLTVDDIASARNILEVCFGKDTGLRKDLLIDHDEDMVDMKAGDRSFSPRGTTKKATRKVIPKTTKKKVAKKVTKKKVAKKAIKKKTTKKKTGKKKVSNKQLKFL